MAARRQRGFTIVEMIVATILLAVGVVAALACIGESTRSTGQASAYSTASLLAQQHLATLEAQPDQITGGDQQGDFGEDYPGVTWSQTSEPTDFPNLVKVTLTIEWPRGAGRASAQFATYESTVAPTSSAPADTTGGTAGGSTGGATGGGQ